MWGLGVRVTVLHTRQPQSLKGSNMFALLLEVVEMGFEPRFAPLLYHDEFLSRHFWLSGCYRSLSYCLAKRSWGLAHPMAPTCEQRSPWHAAHCCRPGSSSTYPTGAHWLQHMVRKWASTPASPPSLSCQPHDHRVIFALSWGLLGTSELFFFCSWLTNLE